MDQLSAHLERGWDLAQRGDTAGASASAQRALELEPNSPEVHNLVGYVAALDGDSDEALEAYQQAIELDDHYVEAMLNAAELMVHPLGDHEGALRLCDQVLDITEFDDEIVDALLLKFEAHAGRGEEDLAKRTLQMLPEGPYDNASQNFLVGRAHYESGDKARARVYIEAAIAADDGHAEAYYYAGLLAEDAGDPRTACVAFLRTRQLELELGMPPWAPNPETFLLFTKNAVGELDERFGPFFETAELFVADVPGPEMVVDGVDPRSMAMIDAMIVDLPEEPTPTRQLLPEHVQLRIFLYAVNIMRAAPALHAVQQTIAEALGQEMTHTFEDLERELEEAQALDELVTELEG